MIKFTTHTGVAVPMLSDNIDTDQIIPSREMKRVSKTGLAEGLFSGQRYLYDGEKKISGNPNFVLNKAQFIDASILLSGKNFGCGSSREHAVWALVEYGFKAIVAESFGEIFFNNSLRNGLLPISLSASQIEQLMSPTDRPTQLHIDLAACTIATDDVAPITFELEDYFQKMLLNGWDFIDLALQFEDHIEDYLVQDRVTRPWAYLSKLPSK